MVDNARIQIIDSPSKLDDFMKFAQLERELVVRLQYELEVQTARLDCLKKIKSVCVRMKQVQNKYKFKTTADLQKQIKKHAGWP